MKTNSWNRNEFRKLAGTSALLAGALLADISPALAQQTNAPAKPAPDSNVVDADVPEFNNWLELGVSGSVVDGNKAQYQRQSELPGNTAVGGVKAFHFEQVLGKKGLLSVDGRGIFDNHDYNLKLKVEHPDVGYVTGGFTQFREYYDADGGFLRSNGLFFPPPTLNPPLDTTLSLDRGTAFVEAGLTLPNWPVLKVRYEHDYRSGAKDSTEWGTTTLTGPGQTVNAAVQKKITPAFKLINEKKDSITADVTHTLLNTDLGLGLRAEWIRNTDSQNVNFFPNQGAQSHTLTQTDGNKDDMINVHGFTDTHINEKFEVTTGYSYTSMEDQIFGSRLDNPATTTATDTRYINLAGASELTQYEMDASLMLTPFESLYIVPAFRIEGEDIAGMSSDNPVTGVNTVGALTTSLNNQVGLNMAESVDIRYTGITNWVWYVRGEWEENRADLQLTTLPATLLTNDWHDVVAKYTVGVNWYPLRSLNLSAQYYHKVDDNNYENVTATPTAYPAFIAQENFNVNDANVRVTWHPMSQVTLVSRYDFQTSTIDMKGFGLAQVQSGNSTTHQFGETLTWSPVNRLYLQLAGNYVLDHTDTPVETDPATAGIVQESENNYWTVNGTIGLALDNKTQMRVGYVYYRSADYADNSTIGTPYGAGGEQHTATAALERQLTKKLRWALQYSFVSYRDDLFGGNLDYTAHTILSSIQYRF